MSSFALVDWLQQRLEPTGSEPVYRQLYRLLCQSILDGHVVAGARLPASRALAKDLGVARNTVTQVYEQLTIEGFITATIGKGTFVQDISHDVVADVAVPDDGFNADADLPLGVSLSGRGRRLVDGLSFSNRQHGPFMAGVPDVTGFSPKVWLRIQNKLWRTDASRLLTYAPAGGYGPLRHEISNYLNSARSVNSTAGQVIITTGIHQALDVVTRLLCEVGDHVWIEEPSYWGVRNLLLSSGLKVTAIPVDDEGLNPGPEHLEVPPRLIVITPSHQYPLGMVMSLSRRRKLLDYAVQHGCWIMEDDYDSEFRFGSRPLPSLQGLDKAGLVLYAGSFSKTLYPGLRVGFLVVPRRFSDAFAGAVAELYREGRLMSQAVLAEYLRKGHLGSHVRRMRLLYAQRRDALITAIQAHYGERLKVIGDKAGLHFVLSLPDTVDDVALSRVAFERGIMVRPLSDYYLDQGKARKGLILGYGCVTPEDVPAAFHTLATAIDEALSVSC